MVPKGKKRDRLGGRGGRSRPTGGKDWRGENGGKSDCMAWEVAKKTDTMLGALLGQGVARGGIEDRSPVKVKLKSTVYGTNRICKPQRGK